MEQALHMRLQLSRTKVNEAITKALNAMGQSDGVLLSDLNGNKLELSVVTDKFKEEILRYIDKIKDVSLDLVKECTELELKADNVILNMTKLISEATSNQGLKQESVNSSSKLPKLTLPTYDGDILKWYDFWDRFEASVHSKLIPEVEKMTFLVGAVKGPAFEAIEGLGTNNRNYAIAVDTLKRRFGNEQILINAHYEALHKLKPAMESPSDCRRVFNVLEKHMRILQSVGEDTGNNGFRTILISKFPEKVMFQLNMAINKDTSVQAIREKLDNIITALELSQNLTHTVVPIDNTPNSSTEALHIRASIKPTQCLSFESNKSIRRFNGKASSSTKIPLKRKAMDRPVDGKRRRRSCIFCNEAHFNDQCNKFKSVKERIGRLGDKCFRCFEKGHMSKLCKRNLKCPYCQGRHNRALCRKKIEGMKLDITNVCKTSHQSHNASYFLQTATAMVLSNKKTYPCRMLLDSGSQRSYMTTRFASILSIKPDKNDLLMIFTFGCDKPIETLSPSSEITIVTRRGIQKTIQVNIVPKIADSIPVPKIPPMDTIDLIADDGSGGHCIDILIGNDYYFSFVKGNTIKLDEALYLADTDLGWIVSGRVNQNEDENTLAVMTYHECDPCYSYFTLPDLPLRNLDVQFLWTLDNIGITESPKTTREDEAINHFNETVVYHEDRYFVKWPWTRYPPELPTNFGLAYGRLKGLLQRSDHASLQEYDEILREQLEAGIIEVVDQQEDARLQNIPPKHYLPHHMVKQVGKRGRLVYDASAKLKDQQSLNECMYRGPCMLQDLTALLLMFRTNKIGLIADVEKAFLQVGLQPDDRDVTRFLWVKDFTKPVANDNIIHFRFCRVPFGIISSPSLLTATIRYHLSKTNESLLKRIADKCYVDNLVTGANTTKEAFELFSKTRAVFNELSMNIRDWTSNDKSLLAKIPEQSKATKTEQVKVLGLLWNVDIDTLQLNIKEEIFDEEKLNNATKREVLRVLASIYDPCGFISPLLMPAKLLLQELWRRKYKWETKLPDDLLRKWKEIVISLRNIETVVLPRYLGQDTEKALYEIHCFTDAAIGSYGTVAYLRVQNTAGVQVTLLMSKTRITPLKEKEDLKIPRLELLGYLIGSRLIGYLEKALSLSGVRKYLWTDSLVVLSWMSSTKLLPPFVARRVEEIKMNTDAEKCYISTRQNPADIATRPELWTSKRKLWFQGPAFLLSQKEKWPKNMYLKNHIVSLSAVAEGLDAIHPEIPEDTNITDEEITYTRPSVSVDTNMNSQVHELKDLQCQFFPDEVKGKKTPLARNLGLFIDVDGVLRCDGRLMHADLSYETKHPVLLPKNCSFTVQVIKDAHEKNYHVGASHTLSIIRQHYWIPQGRAQVKKVLSKCPQCVKHGGGPYRLPETPALPPERVRYVSPYTYVGVDYFGPMFVKSNEGKEKRWICLFTCLVVRAIHLEIVKDLTADECLLAFRRFIATRGVPTLVTSDNALQFKLTSEVLSGDHLTQEKIQWKFIPQLAPWHGGVYERLVAVIKHCLKRTLQKHLLGDNQLLTVMKEVEAVVNTRPLTYVGTDLDYVLRPADFLSLGKCLAVDPSMDQIELPVTTTKRQLIDGWKRGGRIMKEFIEMFISRYLVSLRERYRHLPKQPRVKSHDTPCVGDVVQIRGESKNRENWKVGRIFELIKGPDGLCRVAKVRVENREFIRSIGHLYPLEADITDEDLGPVQVPHVVGPEEYSADPVVYQAPDSHCAPEIQDLPMEVQHIDKVVKPRNEIIVNQEVEPEAEVEADTQIETPPVEDMIAPLEVVESLPPTIEMVQAREEVSPPYEAQVPDGKLRRSAALRAREKIAEWTSQLFIWL